IVSHLQIALVAGSAVKRDSGKPLIFGVHISDTTVLDIPSPTFKKRLFKRQFLKILQEVDGFSFRSASVRTQFLQVDDIGSTPQILALSGIPPSLIDVAPVFTYGKTPHIVTTCRLIKRKNVDAVLNALAELPHHLPWKYTIIGDGPERSILEALVHARGLESRVTFTGRIPREETIRIMRGADIFVLISAKETLGIVYLEALAQGLLTIGARGTGIDGFIHHKDNGYLCPPGDVCTLTTQLTYILLHRPEHIRRKGYRDILNNTQPECAARYLSFICSVTQTPHHAFRRGFRKTLTETTATDTLTASSYKI
ncbi:MAG: glycosyltransferase, partial [Desulfoplanes sp.]|nr:glycosyltransferase [Desulfoplanes sp.]